MTQKIYKNKKDQKSKRKEITGFFENNLGVRVRLGEYADRNAIIMVIVNSLIIPFSAWVLISKTGSLMVFSPLILLLSAITAIIPALYSLQFTLGKPLMDIAASADAERLNLVYSGSFQKISFLQYEESLLRKFEDQWILSGNILQNEYQQGVVLGKKYQLLRICYTIFISGLIASGASAIIILFSGL